MPAGTANGQGTALLGPETAWHVPSDSAIAGTAGAAAAGDGWGLGNCGAPGSPEQATMGLVETETLQAQAGRFGNSARSPGEVRERNSCDSQWNMITTESRS